MSGTPVRVPVPVLREAVRRAVAASSTRAVGAEIGLSHGAVQRFIAGSEPHPGTVLKLSEWYVRHAVETGPVDAETARAVIALLVAGLPEGEREDVRAGLLDLLRDGYRRSGTEPPDWLRTSDFPA